MAAKFKLIDSSAGAPPRPLQQHGMALWRSIVTEYEVSDAAGRELLCLACQALDRAEECRALIDKHGEAVIHKDTGVIRQNPLLRDELANRSFVAKTLERLGVNQEPTKASGRPPGSWSYEKAKVETA
jgi:hypothetical protein